MKKRIVETNEGIQDAGSVEAYDTMMRTLRDRGWMETQDILRAGIDRGRVLEIGPGPGYLGLEWLSRTQRTALVGLEISPEMISCARRNAESYRMERRAEYVEGNALRMPFDADSFDGVFSNGSLHEWEEPEAVLREAWRVVRTGGTVFVSDLRRDMSFVVRLLMMLGTRPKTMRPGLASSIDAAYTPAELRQLVTQSGIGNAVVTANAFGLQVAVRKE